jgi:hypothetical protein
MQRALSFSVFAALLLSAIGSGCGGGVDVETGATSSGTTGSTTGVGGSSSTTGTGMGGSTSTTGVGGSSTTTGVGGSSTTTGVGGSSTTTGVGGAGGGEVCPGFGDLCTACLSTGCPQTYCNCYDNPACFTLIKCINGCNGDAACIQTCEKDNESGISDVYLLTSCAGTTCPQACPNSDGMPVDPCNTCLLTQCEQAANACLVEPECSALYQCLSMCPNLDLNCQQGCYADHGAGTNALQALLQCSSMSCVMACQ